MTGLLQRERLLLSVHWRCRVLYFSLHRYDDGGFFPCSEDAEYDQVGTGKGEGFNINVAWNFDAMGDTEYLLAFYHILLPVALEVREI